MTIPFLDFLKKKPKPAAFVPVAVEKLSGDRLSKTVRPNATRTVGPQDAFVMTEEAPSLGGRQSVAFGGTNYGRVSDLPPAVALALEPRVERTISLELADVFSQLPPGTTKPLGEGDAGRMILLKASEVEQGMASGKPTVYLVTVYRQVPELFLRTIEQGDATQVQLPFRKVLEQFSKLHVRTDQNQILPVPALATPFLQVTLEDDVRFGTTTPASLLPGAEISPVRMELATAETLAAAQPEATATDRIVRQMPMSFPVPKQRTENGNGTGTSGGNGTGPHAPPLAEKAASPVRIPFTLSPKGTDAPAAERVPASSGSSVPTSEPMRIPFKLAVPAATGTPPAAEQPWLTKDNFSADGPSAGAAEAAEAAVNIALSLKPILQNVLPLQLTREVAGVADDAVVEIPFALLAPQLATGRASLAPDVFARYLPEEYRDIFDASANGAAVMLPLSEILKNLPGASLRLRDDQVEQEQGENFATPFSAKAEEDAARFKVSAAPVAKAVPAPGPAPKVEPAKVSAPQAQEPVISKAPAAPVEKELRLAAAPQPIAPPPAAPAPASPPPAGPQTRTALQTALETDDELDAKAVVAHVVKMAGVKACAIMFKDGLSLAGNLPEQYGADGLCAMAPSLLQRIGDHMGETKLGALRAMTLSCAKETVTFFTQDNLCLAAVHEKAELASDIRERLARVLLELSRKYSHPA